MHVAGPINNADEARMLEQAAYLTDLRARLFAPGRPRVRAPPTTPNGPTLLPY